jgi:hypothetical protein
LIFAEEGLFINIIKRLNKKSLFDEQALINAVKNNEDLEDHYLIINYNTTEVTGLLSDLFYTTYVFTFVSHRDSVLKSHYPQDI